MPIRCKRYCRAIICFVLWFFLTAQVPFEYFELAYIEPPAAALPQGSSGASELPGQLSLDEDTKTAGDLTLSEPFEPPVGIYKRKTVFSRIEHEAEGLVIRQSMGECRPWVKTQPPAGQTIRRSALIDVELMAGVPNDIPSDSPEMQILSVVVERTDGKQVSGFRLFQCADDRYYIQADVSGAYRIRYETVSAPDAGMPKDAQFFRQRTYEKRPIGDEKIRVAIEGILKENGELFSMTHKADGIADLIAFFQGFTSEPLNMHEFGAGALATEKAIIAQRKGLCRHRAFLLMLAARYAGFQVRIAANEVHAFVEIFADGRWYPVELGGQASSLTVRHSRGKEETYRGYDFMNAQNDAGRDGTGQGSSMEIVHSSAPEEGAMARMSDVDEIVSEPSLARHDSVFRFVPAKGFPKQLTRNAVIEISGRMMDNDFRPMMGAGFMLEMRHGRRVFRHRIKTDGEGNVSTIIRLPADWPLGNTEIEWIPMF